MRKNSLINVVRAENGTLTFTVGEAGSFDVNPAILADEIRERAMLHGIVQKISDAAAISKADLSGNPETDAKTKLEAMSAVAARLAEGEWSKRSGDGSGPVQGVIYRAFEEFALAKAKKAKKELTPEQVRAVYDAKSRADQLALRTVPEIAAIIERLKSERGAKAAKAIDTDALLNDLGL